MLSERTLFYLLLTTDIPDKIKLDKIVIVLIKEHESALSNQ